MKRADRMIIDWLNERSARRERKRERKHELEMAKINAVAKVGVAFVNRLFSFPRLSEVAKDLKSEPLVEEEDFTEKPAS